MTERFLLLGANGQLGTALKPKLERLGEVWATTRRECDLGDLASLERAVRDFRPTVVFNTAAFHRVMDCEEQLAEALRINVVGQRYLALQCRAVNARFVTYSTDYVFDGEKRSPYVESDPTHPLQMYGLSRLAGELAVQAAFGEGSWIIRTCGVYGLSSSQTRGANFVDARIADLKRLSELEIASEQVVNPTSAEDLAVASVALIMNKSVDPGLYHLANEGQCSWFEFTHYIGQCLGSACVVKPVDRKGLSGAMRRPLYSALANKKAAAFGVRLPHWKEGVLAYLERCELVRRAKSLDGGA